MTRSSPPNAPDLAFLATRVFAPFAAGYFLSYAYRTVNAVLGPVLGEELGIGAVAMGLMTGTYFLAFAGAQIPLGMALDRYGPRRTQSVLLTVAAAGAVLFALGGGTLSLTLARALIGVGVSGCLLAAFKIFALWTPPHRLPMVNGLLLAFGGLGAMAAASPAQAFIAAVGWREMFMLVAAMTVAVAAAIRLVVPERRAGGEPKTLRDQWRGLAAIAGSRAFRSVAPLVVTTQAAWLSIQALWFGPWLRDMAGLDATAAAEALFVGGLAMVCGYASLGWLAARPVRGRTRVGLVAGTFTLAFIGVQVLLAAGAALPAWSLTAAFAFTGGAPTLFYAGLTQQFPAAMAGRVNTSLALPVFALAGLLQLATGAVLDLFGGPGESYTAAGYAVAFGGWAAVQCACFAWFLRARRRQPGPTPRDPERSSP